MAKLSCQHHAMPEFRSHTAARQGESAAGVIARACPVGVK
jgi:hypothetical protein